MQAFIAITVGEITHGKAPWAPIVHGQFHTYVDAVVRAGGLPLLLPLVDNESVLRQLYEQSNGLLLSGGNDLDPAFYNAKRSKRLESPCPKRDKQELRLLEWALADNKPVFGICRGMQLINVGLGGTLHQDVTTEVPATHDHRSSEHRQNFQYIAHRLSVAPGSQLAIILGTEAIDTNALHHQAIDKLGKNLVATAHAEDGVIEAVELPDKRFVIGVQSHPEALEAETEPRWQKLFTAFVDSART